MKQYITEEQWYEEITEQQQDAFSKAVPNDGDGVFPNIGQMIEFLGDENDGDEWGNVTIKTTDVQDVCDTLWESVKHKLNSTLCPRKEKENHQ